MVLVSEVIDLPIHFLNCHTLVFHLPNPSIKMTKPKTPETTGPQPSGLSLKALILSALHIYQPRQVFLSISNSIGKQVLAMDLPHRIELNKVELMDEKIFTLNAMEFIFFQQTSHQNTIGTQLTISS